MQEFLKGYKGKIKRVSVHIINAVLWIWTGASKVMDWIGRSTVFEDARNVGEMMRAVIWWIVSTPWPVPATLGGVLTIYIIWSSWPPRDPAYSGPGEKVREHITLTQAEYDALAEKREDTLYYVVP